MICKSFVCTLQITAIRGKQAMMSILTRRKCSVLAREDILSAVAKFRTTSIHNIHLKKDEYSNHNHFKAQKRD